MDCTVVGFVMCFDSICTVCVVQSTSMPKPFIAVFFISISLLLSLTNPFLTSHHTFTPPLPNSSSSSRSSSSFLPPPTLLLDPLPSLTSYFLLTPTNKLQIRPAQLTLHPSSFLPKLFSSPSPLLTPTPPRSPAFALPNIHVPQPTFYPNATFSRQSPLRRPVSSN